MTEIIYILIMTSGVLLFALGGTTLPHFNRGWKGFRRYIFPLVLFGLLVWAGIYYGIALASCLLLSGVLHLGYGESHGWIYKSLVGASYSLPSLIIGFSWWTLILPPVFILLFFLSNWKVSEKSFTWKIVEAATGFLIGATYVGALTNSWW